FSILTPNSSQTSATRSVSVNERHALGLRLGSGMLECRLYTPGQVSAQIRVRRRIWMGDFPSRNASFFGSDRRAAPVELAARRKGAAERPLVHGTGDKRRTALERGEAPGSVSKTDRASRLNKTGKRLHPYAKSSPTVGPWLCEPLSELTNPS